MLIVTCVLLILAGQEVDASKLTEHLLRSANISLVQGNGYNFGKVRLYHPPTNTYGFICDIGWDARDAKVVCKMLGFNVAKPVSGWYFGEMPVNFFVGMTNVRCVGNETHILDCPYSGWGNVTYCPKDRGAGVICRPGCEVPPLSTIELVGATANSTAGNIRITDIASGQSGYICDHGWYGSSAEAVCKMLGFRTGIAIRGSKFGNVTVSDYLMEVVICGGYETDILECKYNGWRYHTCTSGSEAAGVSCSGTLPP